MVKTYPPKKEHSDRISWSFTRSRVRKDVFKFLVELHPGESYPAEIARKIGSTPSNVRCALCGAPWGDKRFNSTYSLASLDLVDVEEIDGRRYYKATEEGLEVARNLGDKL